MDSDDPGLPLLRHTIATLAYRAAKCLRDAPPGFEQFRAAPTTRTAGAILAHMGDLMDWALTSANGQTQWREVPPGDWDADAARFFTSIKALDDRLTLPLPASFSCEKLFQGPIADALTHVGQLATLRRLAGAGVRGENYFVANIERGRVGADQPPAVREFD